MSGAMTVHLQRHVQELARALPARPGLVLVAPAVRNCDCLTWEEHLTACWPTLQAGDGAMPAPAPPPAASALAARRPITQRKADYYARNRERILAQQKAYRVAAAARRVARFSRQEAS